MDVNVTCAEFHQKARVPFPNTLLSGIEASFDMENIEPVQALLALDPSEIPTTDDTGFMLHGSEKKSLFSFYGMERSDTYAGHNTMHCIVLESGIWWLQKLC